MEQKELLDRISSMGEIRVPIQFENYDDRILFGAGTIAETDIRAKEVMAVVDTGAVMNLLPQDLVEALGLRLIGKTIVALANDERIELNIAGSLTLTVGGRTWTTDCLVGPPGCEVLLGQLVLERLDLIVDPLRQAVTPRPESPYLPTLKLKLARCGPISNAWL